MLNETSQSKKEVFHIAKKAHRQLVAAGEYLAARMILGCLLYRFEGVNDFYVNGIKSRTAADAMIANGAIPVTIARGHVLRFNF